MPPKFGAICLTSFAIIFLPAVVSGQVKPYDGGVRTRSLVTQPVDDSTLVVLSGNMRSEATAANDRGPVPDSFPMGRMLLQLQRPPELEQALVNLLDEMHRPGSPQFHQWMTPEYLGLRFGISGQDMRKITAWLTSHGFQINRVYLTGTVIDFSGTAAQVRAAFHTEIHNLDVDGEAHIANMSDPRIPAALAGAVKGVASLQDFKPHTSIEKHSQFTLGSGEYALAPGDLATIYNLNPLFTAGITGSGQTIAVLEDTNIANAADWSTFRSAFGLSGYTSGSFRQEQPGNCTSPGVNMAEVEAAVDAEWASAAAPGATIVLASCADTHTTFGGLIALENLVNAGSPPAIMSISYGECESQNGSAQNAAYVNAYQLAVAQGVSVFVAAGDEGAGDCIILRGSDSAGVTQGIAVNGFASTPYNVAVGGTDFSDTYSGANSTYWNSTNSPTLESAISYIPEIPWNSSCASRLLSLYSGYATPYGSSGFCNSSTGFLNASAGSGGPSSFSVKPPWQAVLGNPSDGRRDLPDVSFFAGNGVWGHFYIYCMSDTSEPDSAPACDYSISTDVDDLRAGGTSFTAPIMAGIMALVNQHAGGAQGNPNPSLYALAAAEYGASGSSACNSSQGNAAGASCLFYDVTQGDNDVDCTGNINCYLPSGAYGVLSTSNSAYAPAYATNTGWDFATGIGTVNAYNLVYGWVPASTATTVVSGLSPSSYGAPVTFTATIASQDQQAVAGTVAWSANAGCGTTSVTTGSPGVATCVTSILQGGSDTVTATYSGNIDHAGSSGSVSQQVNRVAPAVTFTGAPASAAFGSTFTVAATTNASTTASFLAAGACSISGNTVTMTSAMGTCSLTANWAADSNYNAATATQTTTAVPCSGGSAPCPVYSQALTTVWSGYGHDPQHTATSAAAAQSLNSIHWQTAVDNSPDADSSGPLFVHYGSPVVTAANTVIVPVTTAAGDYQLKAFNGASGTPLYTLSSCIASGCYSPPGPPAVPWTPPYGPALSLGTRLYYPGPGGTIFYRVNPDSATGAIVQVAFYGTTLYDNNQAAFNSTVRISTPLTTDRSGNVFFGFAVTGSSNPAGLVSGIARVSITGAGTWVSAVSLTGDSSAGQIAFNSAPALDNTQTTVYVATSTGASYGTGYLTSLNATTLAPIAHVALYDPRAANGPAIVSSQSSASPMVGPDGDVYYGVLEDPCCSSHNDRGWMLHFNSALTLTKTPGSFGWDNTASVVPSSAVPSYSGTSPYLILTKYNNYLGIGGGNGVNQVAVLDPFATMQDEHSTSPVTVMQEVITVTGVTPDGDVPGAVREWCINTAAIDPFTKSAIIDSEDGTVYRWDFTSNTLLQRVTLTSGRGEAYTPTVIGPDGTVYAINDAILFAVGN